MALKLVSILLCALAAVGVNGDSISVQSTCLGRGDPIVVSFEKDMDSNFRMNWIGIYFSNQIGNLQGLPDGQLWVNLCGNQLCNPGTNPPAGTVTFDSSSDSWVQGWPLVAGKYRAVLTGGDDGETWRPFAVSQEFEVGCTEGDDDDDDDDGGTTDPIETTDPGLVTAQVIRDARGDIRRLLNSNSLMMGKCLRLAFHDCVGGCDGCVDMTNPDNAGLIMPIDALADIVDHYEQFGLSRTDIWMLCAVEASEFGAEETSAAIDFPFQWIGRKTCEELNNNNCGTGADGDQSPCDPFGGPHRVLCHADTAGTATIRDFMSNEFGFDDQQTTAIMGAHTVGAMHAVNLGFDGVQGWDLTNDILDHGYFIEMVGDDEQDAADWEQVFRTNNDVDADVPPRWQYEARHNGVHMTLLNSDVAMVRNLVEGDNLMSDGRVTCDFAGSNACSSNTPFLPFVRQYANSLSEFLRDYRDALDLMIENGYARDSSCAQGEVCVLRSLM